MRYIQLTLIGEPKSYSWGRGSLGSKIKNIMSTERGYQSREKSAKHQKSTSKSVSDADLYELSRNRTSVADFASSRELLSKSGSEIEVISAEKSLGKVARKQAWAPPQRAALSSSSSRFRREPTPSLPPHPVTLLPRHEVRYNELPMVNS